MSRSEEGWLSSIADNVSVIVACTNKVAGVLMGDVMTINVLKKIRMIKPIRINHQEKHGVTGINRENRHTGAEVAYFIQSTIVNTS